MELSINQTHQRCNPDEDSNGLPMLLGIKSVTILIKRKFETNMRRAAVNIALGNPVEEEVDVDVFELSTGIGA